MLRVLDDCDKRIAKIHKHRRRNHLQPSRCSAGCSHCCAQWVGATYLEGKAAWDAARQAGVDMEDLARRAAERAAQALAPGVTRKGWFGKRCLLLGEDGRCTAYDGRPIQCRLVHVTSDPILCGDPEATVWRIDTDHVRDKAYRAAVFEQRRSGVRVRMAELSVMLDLVARGGDPADLPGDETAVNIEEE